MNMIFLTLSDMRGIQGRGIYVDLMRKFRDEGHSVYVVSPTERRYHQSEGLLKIDGICILKVCTLNIRKTNVIEKGLGTLMIEGQFERVVKKYLGDIQFDLVLYSTPPITFANVVKFLKKKNPFAVSYLLLKDIFPQNAVDIGMFMKNSLFYWHFRRKEKNLYKLSDYIGCMSPANVSFIRRNNNYYPAERVEVAPNSIELVADMDIIDKAKIRAQYGLPVDVPIFIYGGNLGKPQGVDYLIQCLEENLDRKDCFFLVVGGGTEYGKLQDWYNNHSGKNVKLMEGLPKKTYDQLVRSCDVGLIFLDYRFTIPNYPSRLLSYLEYKMPIICATDVNTDIGKIAQDNGYGYWCESRNPADFTVLVDKMLQSNMLEMGVHGYQFLKANYLVEHTYQAIIKHCLK